MGQLYCVGHLHVVQPSMLCCAHTVGLVQDFLTNQGVSL